MKTSSKAPLAVLKMIFFSLISAQKVKVLPSVTGYLGHDVTLPCQFILGPSDTKDQLQWELQPAEGKKINIVVSHHKFGVNVSDSFLKGRVEIKEESLIIHKVEMRDEGSYTCSITAFPSGSLKGTTQLHVQEQMPLSSGSVSAIVIAVIVLLVVIAAVVYQIRRCDATARQRVSIDTGGAQVDVGRQSFIVRDENVVYSDVKLKRSRDSAPSPDEKHTDDVTYSEVFSLRQQPKSEEMCV
uniref:nectin-2-like n=1 Tax=Gasterosteus aculeatus aculeatus TaxID=481459 RepID=UPI001A9A12F1|nr:nectin-2-like [Gasterosteus aculeatus aculeatus]